MKLEERSWINTFLNSTEDLTKPVILKNQIEHSSIKLYESLILNVFTKFATIKESKRIRVYLDDYSDIDTSEILYKNTPLPKESFLEWSKRSFKNKQFGIILNNAQNYSDELLKNIHKIFSPLADKLGIPYGGFDVTFFLGNYGYTPLGFHQDPEGSKVTHLHLGPGKKEMYLIEKDLYENRLKHITLSMNGYNGCKEYKKLIPFSEKFIIEEGDIFFMPPGYYHVGNSPEISAAITVWHIEPTVKEYQNRAIIKLVDKIFSNSNNLIVKTEPNKNSFSKVMESISDTINIDEEYKKLTLEEIFPNLIKDHFNELCSNGYFNSKAYPTEHSAFLIDLDKSIKINKPFKIIFKVIEQNNIVLFIRGHRLIIPNNSGFNKFFKEMNRNKGIKIKKAVELLSKEWEEEAIIDLISLLIKYRGITIITEEDSSAA